MIYVGIDPGKSGAIAFLKEDHPSVMPIPMIDKKTYNLDMIVEWFRDLSWAIRGAAVERQTPMPVSLGGAFSNYGRGESLAWEWMFRSHGIPVVRPLPRQWQTKAFLVETEGDTKTRSLLEAQRRWPGVNLHRTAKSRLLDDGMADALHLAQYAKEHFR